MFVLDTNVLSELMNPGGARIVVDWANSVAREDQYTTTVNLAEVLYGLAIIPKGRKRTDRLMWAEKMFAEDFRGRILPFDQHAAEHFADIAATREQAGKRIEALDVQVAAIARANGMTVVTRNVRHFIECGIDVLDPWSP